MKLILTDIDEVILKWQDSFYVWFLKNKIKNNNIITKLGIRPDFDQWIDIYPDNFNDTIITFNKSESFGKLIPYDSALVELPILKNLGYKFIGITACGVDVTTKTLRRNNLEYYFPGIFEEIHFSDINKDKDTFLKMYPFSWWIDDRPKHLDIGYNFGHNCLLYSQNYNLSCQDSRFTRVNDWHQISIILSKS